MIDTIHQGRQLPYLNFRQIDLPEVEEWEVNSEHYLVVKVEMVSKNNRSDLNYEDHGKIEGGFQIVSVRAVNDKPVDVKQLEREETERVIAKVKAGEYA